MINQNTRNDDLPEETSPKGAAVPLEQSPQLNEMLQTFAQLHEALQHNTPVTTNAMEAMRHTLHEQRYIVGDQSFTREELSSFPNLKRTFEIWEEIERGTYGNIAELLLLTDKVATRLSTNLHQQKPMNLGKLKTITNHQVDILAGWEGTILDLNGLISLNDEQIQSLSEWKGLTLFLNGLTELSDEQAKSLEIWGGEKLFLNGLTELSDDQAESLGKWKGDYLHLIGITKLNDAQTRSMGEWKGRELFLSGLTELSDVQAAALGRWRCRGKHLDLNGIIKLSDDQAKSLNQFRGTITCKALDHRQPVGPSPSAS